MCGRFALRGTRLREKFPDFDFEAETWRPRYNASPSQQVLAATNDPAHPKPRVELLRWGLIPSWAKDTKIGFSLINARSEEVEGKPAYRNAWKCRRAVVFADGFIEWREENGKKQPYLFELQHGEPFALAALWEDWKPEGAEPVRSCTILTCTPNSLVATIHDRMPVLLDPDQVQAWLVSAGQREASKWLCRPYPAERMTVRPISPMVNKPANDTPEVLESPAKAG